MHTMTLIREHEGMGEWLCSVCGRRLLVSWNPVFKKTILVEGDPSANHIRIKKNSQSGEQPAALLPKPGETPMDDPKLDPWLTWMEESGFEDLWNA